MDETTQTNRLITGLTESNKIKKKQNLGFFEVNYWALLHNLQKDFQQEGLEHATPHS